MMGPVLAQSRFEILLALRQGERMLATMVIPVGILLFFSIVDILPAAGRPAVDFLAPGMLALAAVSNGMVGLGIATAFERQTGVLKRIGVTPLGRGGLLAGKLAAVVVVAALQVVAIVAVAFALGWRPQPHLVAAVVLFVAGTVAFCGLGFLLAGLLRAEANLAVLNGLFLVMLFLGGTMVPRDSLPGPLAVFSRILPAEPLASGLRQSLESGGFPVAQTAVVGIWAIVACGLAVVTFRWE